ncbi:Alpha/beta hydrolase family-domain-containing protein [Aspergillus karnatakaensis]|uniref:putative toxin biosynthesis protein n=1 Tax=Aspergillus karnatakaensis TaxID=1810916 RepID=UPI003CCE4D3F
MAFPFNVVEHVLPGQHIREFPQSIKCRQETPLNLSIKQYTPLDQTSPIPDNAVTIIGVPGNGSPKEVYEPLWEDLYRQLQRQSVPLRGIWVADVSNQGASGVLNEDVQGDQTHWYDHSRDLLHMVNHFRNEIPRPIIGVAHSMGCAQLVNLAIMHPRLLSTLILFEPVILDAPFGGPNPAFISSRRRDLWETPEKATSSLTKSLRTWDPRARARYIRFGLRPVPTSLYNPATDPKIPKTAMTLTTTKHQESWSFMVPNLEPESAGLDRLLLPDWDAQKERSALFSRPECWSSFRNLPFLRPGVLWVFGGKSYLFPGEKRASKVHITGTGVGGSGGTAKGMVERAVLKDGTHTLVFEQVGWCAEVSTDWIGRWYKGWLEDEKFWQGYKSKNSDEQMLRLSDEALKAAQRPMGSKRPGSDSKL